MTEPHDGAAESGVVIEDVPLIGGLHCETTTAGVLLSAAGIDLSEPMLFGLGSGLSFVYWDSKRQDFPFLGGRVKPFVLTQNLARRLNLTLAAHETSSDRRAWEQVRRHIDGGIPVGLQLDSFDLEYFTKPVHFAGHFVAMYGYDERRAYLVDTLQQGGAVSTSLDSLARARAARGPMAARRRWFTIGSPADGLDPERLPSMITSAIVECAANYLHPPIANLGNRGIETAARRVLSWPDRIPDPAATFPLIATLMERAGTGGALFRNLYRDFLDESRHYLSPDAASVVIEARHRFDDAARLWTMVAETLDDAATAGDHSRRLVEVSGLLKRIATIELAAMQALSKLT